MKVIPLNKEQSLGYQIRTILMNEHYLSRFDEQNIGENDGDNLIIKFDEFENLVYLIFNKITENYKNKISKLSLENSLNYVIDILNNTEKKYCEIQLTEDELIFKMNSEGYRYQFNGYMSSEDKRNLQNAKLTKKANWFIGMTLVYYIVTFIIKDIDYNINEYIKSMISLIKVHSGSVLVIVCKILLTFIANIILIKFIADYLENKINNI